MKSRFQTNWFAALLLAAVLIIPSVAAADTFCLLQPDVDSASIDATSTSTFMMLFDRELESRGAGAVRVPDGETPDESICDVVVETAIGQLGARVFVSTTWEGTQRGAAQVTASSVEELDTVAAQLATRIVTGRTGDMAHQLGEVTDDDAAVDQRIGLQGAFLLRLGTHIPMGGSYNSGLAGPAVEIGYWAEAREFALEARTGARWASDRTSDGTGGYGMWNLDLGGFWLPSSGNFSPILGGGVGLRYASSDRVITETTGTIVQMTQTAEIEEYGFGVGAFARVGVLLLRTYRAHISVHVDMEMTTINMNDNAVQGGALFGLAAHF